MLPLPRLGGAHLSRMAAYMGLALHEMPWGYALLKMSDASSCVISFDKRFSKLTLFSCSTQIQLLLKWFTLVGVNTYVNIKL